MLPSLIPASRAFALTLLLTSTILAGAAEAAPIDTTRRAGPPSTEWNLDSQSGQKHQNRWATINNPEHPQQRPPSPVMGEGCDKSASPRQMSEHCPCMKPMRRTDAPLPPDAHKMLEDRIGSLHAKLGITPEQEPVWQKVEQAMRANESTMRAMITEKRARADERNAVEALKMQQSFAQTHADNLANVIVPFKNLYDAMPESQRKNADAVFKEFRGMGGLHRHGHHEKHAQKHKSKRQAQHGHEGPASEAKNAAPAAAAPMPAAAAPATAPAVAQ
ncbi:MAG: Spy/CpxP family protein refolding chaperone [Bdellovibrionales bacterium]